MLPTLAALSLGDDDCGDCACDLSTDVPTDVNRTPKLSDIMKELERRRKAKKAVDRVIAKEKKAEQAAAEKAARKVQKEAEKEAKAAKEAEERLDAEERELASKAFRDAEDATKTLTIQPIEAWTKISSEYHRVFVQLLDMLYGVQAKFPGMFMDNDLAKFERERADAALRAEAARVERQAIKRQSDEYKKARAAGTRAPMSEAEKEVLANRYKQLEKDIAKDDAIVAEYDAKFTVDELVRSLVEAGNRTGIKLSVDSVDVAWDAALRAFVPEAGARAKQLYNRRTIDMIASYSAPRGVRILMDPRWVAIPWPETEVFRKEISRIFNPEGAKGRIRYLSGKEYGDPVRVFINDNIDDPATGLLILKGLAFEIAVSKVDIALAEYRVDFDLTLGKPMRAPAASSSTDDADDMPEAPEVAGL